ncbi:3'(2'),5'-bisphosphate nucleotidase CysQ [Chakrabartia godavariana]|nr:3'(2'),5'-bisphosphate nucleotidase CysQ [Chakrabartia godavariana]
MTEARLDALSEIAREAGALALSRFRGAFEQWEKAPGNPVSEVDLAVDRFLKDALKQLDPDAGWLSEETADNAERLLLPRVWVVDPIDGTRDYVRGRDGWAVSIALVEGGRATLAVLDAPARNEHWRAARGQGAVRNGATISASTRADLPGARVPADVLPKADLDLVPVHKPNSIALRIAMVAADEADLVAALRWGNEWDIAAAALIAEEAGGKVTDAHGRPLRFNSTKGEAFGVLATGTALHAAAVARLEERARTLSVR